MVECLNGGNGRQVREMSASQVMGVKALWSPRHSSRWIPEGLGAQAFASSLPLSHKGTMSQDWKSSLSFGFPGGSVIKNLPANAGDTGDMCPILGREDPLEEKNGHLLQYSCLGNPMNGGAWRATVHGVANSQA